MTTDERVKLMCRPRSPIKNGLFVLLASMLVALQVFTGCSHQDPASRVAAMNDSNIKRVANLYMAHQTRRGAKGPEDEAAFKIFIQNGIAPHRLEMMQVNPADVDALFTSERDGQPFVVRYGLSGGRQSALAVVFEREGKEGKRQVAFTDGSVEEVDDARYEALLQGTN